MDMQCKLPLLPVHLAVHDNNAVGVVHNDHSGVRRKWRYVPF